MPWSARVRWLLLALLLLAPPSVDALAQIDATVRIAPPIIDQFPDITLYLSISDGTGRRIPGLPTRSFEIVEDGALLGNPAVQEVRVGTRQVFVINTVEGLGIRDSRGRTRFDFLRQALINWWSSPSASKVANDDLTLITAGGALLAHRDAAAELASTLDRLQPDFVRQTGDLNLLTEGLDFLSDPAPRPGMPSFVIFLTPPLEETAGTAALENAIVRAQDIGAAIYVVAAGNLEAEDPAAELLRRLANETGGEFFLFDPAEGLSGLADQILAQRLQYQLTYRSRITSAGDHTVQVRVGADGLDGDSETRAFSVDVRAPEIAFIQPPNRIVRQSDDPALDTANLPPTQAGLEILVTFPDNHPRSLMASRLLVNGEVVAENTEPPFDRFTWDLSTYSETTEVVLQATVEDSLTLVGQSVRLPVTVEVNIPRRGLWVLQPAVGSMLAAFLILVAGIALATYLLSSGRRQAAAGARPAATERLRRRIRRAGLRQPPTPDAIEAFLVPQREGAESPIPLTGVDLILGRDASLAAHPIDDPSVDGLHARLIRLADGTYLIRDQGSVAGTWVNFEAVPEEGTRLQHNDRIHLGRAEFRFRLPDAPPLPEIRVVPDAGNGWKETGA